MLRRLRADARTRPLLAGLLLLAGALAACGPEPAIPETEPGDGPLVRVASFDFAESQLLAEVYAQAAEARGAWDARLEALVVDALLRGESDDSLRSRAAALGWGASESVVVVVGETPDAEPEVVVDEIRRVARASHLDVLTGVQGDRLVAILGGGTDPVRATRHLVSQFGPGPVVVGPSVPDLLAAGSSATAAVAGLMAARAWPEAPRPVLADDLLPERAVIVLVAGHQDADLGARVLHRVVGPASGWLHRGCALARPS